MRFRPPLPRPDPFPFELEVASAGTAGGGGGGGTSVLAALEVEGDVPTDGFPASALLLPSRPPLLLLVLVLEPCEVPPSFRRP